VAEQPVEAQSGQAAPHRAAEYPTFPAATAHGESEYSAFPAAYAWHPPVPRVVVKADLLPALSVLSTVSLLGLAIGWLWSRLAPPQRKLIYTDGTPVPLTDESYHRFDALVTFMFLALAAGLVVGVAVWYLRERRGPVVMLAAVAGGVLGGWLAMSVGTAWGEGRWPAPASVEVGDLVSYAPVLESSWILLAWPLMTALAYGVLAAMNGMDDLGRRLG
jgi:hypothetical protein